MVNKENFQTVHKMDKIKKKIASQWTSF
jgi:hypothetical protein